MSNICGRCRREFTAGEPRQIIEPDSSRAIQRRFVRCEKCAEGQPPADLPVLVSRQVVIEPSPLVRAGMVKLPFDYRMRQTGEREPGEDG